MRRRAFLTTAGASAVLLPAAWTWAAAGPVLREDSALISAERLARLDAAVGEMQRRSARDPDDPSGWRAHALTHLRVCSAVGNGAPEQVHGCWWFLPWHRAFLAVTEWKLRAIAGDSTLALPYWNWSTHRRLPEAFTRPGTPLANAARHTPDRALRPAEVDHLRHDPALERLGVGVLGATEFLAHAPDQIPHCFGGVIKPNPGGWHGRSRVECVPHGAIHNYVGGESADGALGDMTELSTAALDPVFYAHHANLDRLWERWRNDPGRRATEPSDPEMLAQAFTFPWLDGTPVRLTVAETLDTGRLGYGYDSLAVFLDGIPDAPALPTAPAIASATLQSPAGNTPRCELRIDGVAPGSRPISVEIVVARPGQTESGISVGAFAAGRRHSEPVYPDTVLRFDISAALHRLRAREVVVSVVALPLGSDREPPPFVHGGMSIVSAS